MCTVSIIIPVYNAEKTLRKCVESIVFGIFRDLEVILVEDHSADRSWELCNELSQQFENVRALRNDRNRGVSYTRNHGLDAATGEYIMFCDSDDWVAVDYIRILLECAVANPDALVCCGYTKCYTNTEKKVAFSENNNDVVKREDWFKLMDQELIHYVWNKCFVRKVIQQASIRFDESQYMGEDFQFVLHYALASGCEEIYVHNDPLYFYTQTNPQSLVSRWSRIENLSQAISRIRQLAAITNKQAFGEQKVTELKDSFVYLIARDRTRTRRDRIKDIAYVTCEKCAVWLYCGQRWNYCKERISKMLKK